MIHVDKICKVYYEKEKMHKTIHSIYSLKLIFLSCISSQSFDNIDVTDTDDFIIKPDDPPQCIIIISCMPVT